MNSKIYDRRGQYPASVVPLDPLINFAIFNPYFKMKILMRSLFLTVLLFLAFLPELHAQKYRSDNGDGSYTNPLIFADFPDPDVIRVDSAFYMVSTTMFVFPGVSILKSYDLVNWEYCSNAVERMDFSPCYDLDSCHRYGHGQWATSLRYHEGLFYLLFITLDEGGLVATARKPEGPWELKKLPRGFYDPGLFFDDDGRIYVAHGYNDIRITELDKNLVAIAPDSLVFRGDIRDIRPGLEGTHVYKVNGYYYLYCTYGGWDGFQVALRSGNIYGPYEEKIVIRDNGNLESGIHQGALVTTPAGEWWSVIFQDGGPFGRFPTLQPVSWEKDWPMVGYQGSGVGTWKKPDVGAEYPLTDLPASDEFNAIEPGMQWGWNHNPDNEKWSLEERPGFLRLYTSGVTNDLRFARNTLTQRIFAYYSKEDLSAATVRMDLSRMKAGDLAGLTVFQDPYACIAVKKVKDGYQLLMNNNGTVVDSVRYSKRYIYLRAVAGYGNSKADFYFSTDNRTYRKLGNSLGMKFSLSVFTGNKFGIFNYATDVNGGYVDIDWFRTEAVRQEDVDRGSW